MIESTGQAINLMAIVMRALRISISEELPIDEIISFSIDQPEGWDRARIVVMIREPSNGAWIPFGTLFDINKADPRYGETRFNGRFAADQPGAMVINLDPERVYGDKKPFYTPTRILGPGLGYREMPSHVRDVVYDPNASVDEINRVLKDEDLGLIVLADSQQDEAAGHRVIPSVEEMERQLGSDFFTEEMREKHDQLHREGKTIPAGRNAGNRMKRGDTIDLPDGDEAIGKLVDQLRELFGDE